MGSTIINDFIADNLPSLFKCGGLLPLVANCQSAPGPLSESAEDPVASVAPSIRGSASGSAASLNVPLHTTTVPHPYYPLGVEIAGYVPNNYSAPRLLAIFVTGCAGILLVTYLVAKKIRPRVSRNELLRILWFALSGCIHIFFEGFYVINRKNIAGSQHLYAQMWKEYALSDSRYLTQSRLVMFLETVTTVFWGPFSLLATWLIIKGSTQQYIPQALVSAGKMQGSLLYYATAFSDYSELGLGYSRPEEYYFWVYLVGMTAFWLVIPMILLVHGVLMNERILDEMKKTKASYARFEQSFDDSPINWKKELKLVMSQPSSTTTSPSKPKLCV